MSDAGQAGQVALKPILGIRPGIWLSALYGTVLLLILYFLLLHPGIRDPGSVVSFSSTPPGAAVMVDGVYRGTTPFTAKLPQGKHRFEMTIPGFTSLLLEREIPGRVFASRFFPRRVSVEGRLECPDPAAALLRAAEDFARWSFAGEPTAGWQIPLALSEGVSKLDPAADPALRAVLDAILAGSLGYANTRAALRDFLRARFLLDTGAPPSPLGLLHSGRKLAALAARPGAALALGNILDGGAAARLRELAWYREDAARKGPTPVARADGTRNPGGLPARVVFMGAEFVYVPGGELVPADAPPEKTGGFWICRSEAGPALWAAFLAARPEWREREREELERRGLAGPGYLESAGGNTGVAGVSWHAARAFCAWLGGEMAAVLPGDGTLEVRLPWEREWEYAARLSVQGDGPALQNILGGLWEWCGDDHVPLDFLVPQGAGAVPSPEKNLRGGAWINPPGTVHAGTRASLAPETCSPFAGFRPVIAPPLSGAERKVL